jgi:putative hemolysin
MSTSDIVYIVFFVICVLLSAYFAAAEVAFMSLQRFKLEGLLQKNVKGAKLVAWLKDHPERLLSTVLFGNNLVNTAASALGTALILGWLKNEQTGILVSTVVVTIILLVFGDAIPKTSAAHNSEKVSLKVAHSIKIASWILTPFVFVLSWITSTFGRIFGARPVGRSLVSEEEIRTMINVGTRDGTVEEAQADLLHKVFEFSDRPAREIMVPRTEVTWVEKGTKIEDFFKIYIEHPHTRYPVFYERLDNVVGVISSKDMLMSLAQGTCDIEKTIDDIIRPAYFAPESKQIGELLAEMRDNNYHLCVIVDEYGGTAGVLTLTAIVEEIVGEVKDELSGIENDYEIIDEFTFQIAGSMRIEEVNEEMNLGIPKGDYDTVAGFILKLLGHIPKAGEQIKYRDLKMVITHVSGFKIEEVMVTKEKHAAAADKV